MLEAPRLPRIQEFMMKHTWLVKQYGLILLNNSSLTIICVEVFSPFRGLIPGREGFLRPQADVCQLRVLTIACSLMSGHGLGPESAY